MPITRGVFKLDKRVGSNQQASMLKYQIDQWSGARDAGAARFPPSVPLRAQPGQPAYSLARGPPTDVGHFVLFMVAAAPR